MWSCDQQRGKTRQLQRDKKDDCGADILEEEAKRVIKLSLRQNSWMKTEHVEKKIFLLEENWEQELNQISHCEFKPKHMTLKLHIVCGTIWTLVHHIWLFACSRSRFSDSWILMKSLYFKTCVSTIMNFILNKSEIVCSNPDIVPIHLNTWKELPRAHKWL